MGGSVLCDYRSALVRFRLLPTDDRFFDLFNEAAVNVADCARRLRELLDGADGGLAGRYRTYWEEYSFGELFPSAQTRKAVLERLVPRLKIADRCSFSDRFLVVRGDLRTYKIHLGSGNILMSPNDQYLCIVPRQGAATAGSGKVFLPFEGDDRLSIILSKALLLAEDWKIKDPAIRNQIASASVA